MLDKFDREINYIRISVTDRCNLRCTYCVPPNAVLKEKKSNLSPDQIISVVKEGVNLGIKKIRLTGGEPLLRKDIFKIIKDIRSVNGVEEIALTTNGTLLSKYAVDLKNSGLDRINISLDTLDPLLYKKLTGSENISVVIQGIESVKNAGFKDTKINMVLIPGVNDKEIEKMKIFCRDKGVKLQRINQYSLSNIESIDRSLSAERPKKCSSCNRIRLTSDGKLKPCLFSDTEIDLDKENLSASIKEAIRSKPPCGSSNNSRGNWEIGG